MDGGSLDTFRASLNRCVATPVFLKDFYDLFIRSSEAVRDKFRDTDLERQARMVKDSLHLMAVAAQSGRDTIAWGEMERLARRHSRADRDVPPELYDLWLDCLLQAVRKHDPEGSPAVESAWREALAPGIAYMKSLYAGG
jgi:hemoglobin-like flavoprotein